jgi:excisionase family DNA binding protein
MAIISRPFLTVDEISDLLRVSREWVLRAIHQGTLGHFIIAAKPRITPEQLFEWLRLMEKTPKYGARALSVLEREGIWELTEDGWQWRPHPETARPETGDR